MDGQDLTAYRSEVIARLGTDYPFEIPEESWPILMERYPKAPKAAEVITLGLRPFVTREGYKNGDPIPVDADYLAAAEDRRQHQDEDTRRFEKSQIR